jgi:hypothetical protein
MELKVYHCNEWHNEYTEFYLKNEADKLIERKDKAFEYAQSVILVDIAIIKKHKIKRCLAMAEWCEATALWCYQAANTLPVGIHATLYGKPVMIEPKRLLKRFELLNKWNKRWLSYAEKIKKG